jgi:hypothetical protein
VSLILEALKKLERERQSPDRGFLLLGPATWSEAPPDRRRMAAVVLGAVALGAAAGTAFWRLRDARAERAGSQPAASIPMPTASPAAASAPSPVSFAIAAPTPVASAMPRETRVPSPSVAAVAPETTDAPEGPTLGAAETASSKPPDAAPANDASAAPAGAETHLKLQAISRRDGRLVAVLGDRLVYEGDTFDGIRVLRIGEAEVELEIEGRRVVIGF